MKTVPTQLYRLKSKAKRRSSGVSSSKVPPHKKGFASELRYPTEVCLPSRGDGPRCEVIWDEGDGPWAIVIILEIKFMKNGAVTQEYMGCLMPKCYAIPLMLINKKIAFMESLRTPEGEVVKMPQEKKLLQLKRFHLLEYTYLWKLRTKFLQAIYDAEYDLASGTRDYGPNWRWLPIHGYLIREYEGWGHDTSQRTEYWREAVKAKETPYKNRKVEDFEWKALLQQNRRDRRLKAYLWACIGQGLEQEQTYDAEGWLDWHSGKASWAEGSDQAYELTHGQLDDKPGARGSSSKRELIERLSRRATSRLQSEARYYGQGDGECDRLGTIPAADGANEEEDQDLEEMLVRNMVFNAEESGSNLGREHEVCGQFGYLQDMDVT